MDFITGKHLPRRTFLRGMGATVALPFLDAMIPAGKGGVVAGTDRTRLIAIELSHGAAGSSDWGKSQYLWAAGNSLTLAPRLFSSMSQRAMTAPSLPAWVISPAPLPPTPIPAK